MLSQVKHQHWRDEMAWPDTRTCIAFAPLLFILFLGPSQLFTSWILQEISGNFRYTHSAWCGRKDAAFWNKTRYVPRVSFAIWMRIQWIKYFGKGVYAFLLFKSQNKITDQGQTFRKAFSKGQYYFWGAWSLKILFLKNSKNLGLT